MEENLRDMLFELDMDRRRILRPYFTELGLTVGQGQPRILNNLLKYGSMTQKELADVCRMDVATMSRTLDRLEEVGFLNREKNPECRRSFKIVLTNKGQNAAKKVSEGFLRMDACMKKGLSSGEIHNLVMLLAKVRRNLEDGSTALKDRKE